MRCQCHSRVPLFPAPLPPRCAHAGPLHRLPRLLYLRPGQLRLHCQRHARLELHRPAGALSSCVSLPDWDVTHCNLFSSVIGAPRTGTPSGAPSPLCPSVLPSLCPVRPPAVRHLHAGRPGHPGGRQRRRHDCGLVRRRQRDGASSGLWDSSCEELEGSQCMAHVRASSSSLPLAA